MQITVEITSEMIKEIFPPRRKSSHKGDNGVVLVVGGSRIYHGAPIFSALGAYRAGVDLVYLAVPEKISTPIRAYSPSFIVFPLPDVKLTEGCVNKIVRNIEKGKIRANSAIIGPGLAGHEKTIGLLAYKLSNLGIRLVIDASALRSEVIRMIRNREVVITPHEGEFLRVFGEKLERELEKRAEKVKKFANDYGVVILLKGPTDVISDGKEVYFNKTGTAGMTVGGTGDVLSGLVAGFMARGLKPLDAAIVAAYINGLAGERATDKYGFHFLTEEMIKELCTIMKEYDRIVD